MKRTLTILITLGCFISSCINEASKMEYHIITEDIDNFWQAYDALGTSKDSIATFQTLFIDKATPEFKKFIELRGFFSEQYVSMVKNNPKFLKSIRPKLESIKNRRKEIDKVYEDMAGLYEPFG